MSRQKLEADVLSRLLRFNLATVAEAVRWADEQIAESEVPDPALCELAASSKKYAIDVALALEQVPGNADRRQVEAAVFAQIHRRLAGDFSLANPVALLVFDLLLRNEIEDELARSDLYWWIESLDLAAQGIIPESREEIIGRGLPIFNRLAQL